MTPEVDTCRWQPIATAPKNGTDILIGGGSCPYVHINAYRTFGRTEPVLEGLGDRQQPTHWQPLPAPPADALAAVLEAQEAPAARPDDHVPGQRTGHDQSDVDHDHDHEPGRRLYPRGVSGPWRV
jgi:hypothetical protein